MKKYISKSGEAQFKPSIKQLMAASALSKGYCLACGKPNSCVEPDARKYICQKCGKPKVYGSEELVLMGLCY